MLYYFFVMLYYVYIKLLKLGVILIMADKEMQSVTIRIPRVLYAEYKKALLRQGKIVTYDVRNYMAEVVEKQTKGQK